MSQNKLGDFLKENRVSLDISLRKLAEISGVSFSHLSKIERGEHQPSKETLEILAQSLNIDIYQLFLLAGYSTEADMIYWTDVYKKTYPSKEFTESDVIRLRSAYVHGMIDDELAEKITDYSFEKARIYSSNYNRKSDIKIVNEIKEELGDEYKEWLDVADQLMRRGYRAKNIMKVIQFYENMEREIENLRYLRWGK